MTNGWIKMNAESKPFHPYDPWYEEDEQTQRENFDPEPTVRSHENLLGDQNNLSTPAASTKKEITSEVDTNLVDEDDDLLDFDFDEALLD